MYKPYTGVGSRETPPDIYELMQKIGYRLSLDGFTLRSGGAYGADQAFELGWWDHHCTAYEIDSGAKPRAEIFLPWNGFEDRHHGGGDGAYIVQRDKTLLELAEETASVIHPAWNAKKADGTPVLSRGAKGMHARNCFQVLGEHLDNPSKFLICWAPPLADGSVKGGTRTAWVLAQNNSVPCWNLHDTATRERLEKYVEGIL